MKRVVLAVVVFVCVCGSLCAQETEANTVTVRNTSGQPQSNRPVSVARPFRQGDIPHFARASVNGTPVLTQCDVKNRWSDGSLKFAVVSFVIPTLSAGETVTVSFSDQATGQNDGYLTKAELLDAAYDFEATIEMTSGNTQTVSARQMLSNDSFRYWLRGPVVTAVIIEDRTPARSYDKDFGDGSKALHPIVEAWFYPQTKDVDVGVAVENIWASSTTSKSMRDLTYSVVLKSGNASPATELSQPPFNHIGRSRWQHRFWVGSAPAPVRVDHNPAYLVTTRAIPNYDTSLAIAESLITAHFDQWNTADKTLDGGSSSIGSYGFNLGATGQADHIGLSPTWDTMYLLTMDDRMLEKSLGNADLAGRIPIFLREADTLAGTGDYFDVGNSVDTFGRPISVNARQTISLNSLDYSCGGNYDADALHLGNVSNGGFSTYGLDPHHFPNVGYVPYLMTGRFYYLEQVQLEAAFMVGYGTGCYGYTPGHEGTAGYLYRGEPRGWGWGFRSLAYAAFISPDASPEKEYFEDKLLNNIALAEGWHGVSCSDATRAAHCNYGAENVQTSRGVSPLGAWDLCPTAAQPPIVQDGSVDAPDCPWENGFIIAALGVARDFGYNSTGLLRFNAQNVFGQLLSPDTVPYLIEQYTRAAVLTPDGRWISTWAEMEAHHDSPQAWRTTDNADHGYGFIMLAATGFLWPYTAGGTTGEQAWDFFYTAKPNKDWFRTDSPKWAILPRTDLPQDTPPAPPATPANLQPR